MTGISIDNSNDDLNGGVSMGIGNNSGHHLKQVISIDKNCLSCSGQ